MIDIIALLLVTVCGTSIVYMLLDIEIKNRKSIVYVCLIIGLVAIASVIVWTNYGFKYVKMFYPLLVQMPSYIAFSILSKHKGIKLFFVMLTAVILTAPAVLVAVVVSSFFNFDRTVLATVRFSAYVPLLFIVYKYFRPSFLYMLRNADKGWFGFCTIPLSYYILSYFSGKYYSYIENWEITAIFHIMSLILTLASYVLILRFFKQTREQMNLENEQAILITQIDSAKLHLEALQESQEKTIIYRHDLRHNLQLINAYLMDNNVDEARAYISTIEKSIEDTVVESYCQNYTVNLILSSYVGKAKREGITFAVKAQVPEAITIANMDICIILANAIENAIHASLQVYDPNKRAIALTCYTKNDKLYIQIINNYEHAIAFDNDLPKSSRPHHGYGTKSIAKITEKYNGMHSFEAQGGVFKVSIIL
ncbi:MAG: sensor histidine kinase [Hyphomonadaceae bacterium]|nr:sensor histidine kinase [Clostridia bacterium]